MEDHFIGVNRVIEGGRWGKQTISDVQLSRYACYLIVQNADPSKRIVVLGQAYFAIQTRSQELAQELAGKTDDQQRLIVRDQIAEKNGQLAETASGASIVTQRDFAIFQDHGYRGLYGGESARDIAARKGLGAGEHILDYMGLEESVDNLFRIVQHGGEDPARTDRDQRGGRSGPPAIGKAVREAIIGMGGTRPELLPTPEKSIKQIRREEARQLQIEAEDRLGLFAQLGAGNGDDETGNGQEDKK